MASETIFELKDVHYEYDGGIVGLRYVSCAVAAGQRVAVLGANASGKSTLLSLMDGLIFPTTGQVTAFGQVLTENSVEALPYSRFFRQSVALLFQNADAQLFNPTVEDELAFGPLQLRLPDEEVRRRIREVAQMFNLSDLLERSPSGLSGGEKKRVALASLLTVGPSVLLLDEPTAGLDPRTRGFIVDVLRDLHHAGVTLVIATHDLRLAERLSDRALVLSEDHRLVRDGSIEEVLSDEALLAQVNLIHRPGKPLTSAQMSSPRNSRPIAG